MLDQLRRYDQDYVVEAIDGPEDALARLEARRAAGAPVAMVLADLVLTPRDGVEVLLEVRRIAPTSKRVLLLEWGLHPEQMAAVARAASLGLIDTVLAKPTGPRDEDFHGALTEELGDWAWTTAPVVSAVKVVGSVDHERVRTIADVLERLGVPATVHAPDSTAGRDIVERAGDVSTFPVIEVMGEVVLVDPTNRQLATAFGAVVDVATTVFDLAIVGAGPAGLGAAVTGASEGLSTVIFEAEAFGGQAGTSSMIRNYLGFPRGVTGRQLARRAVTQAIRFGASFDLARAVTGLIPGEPHGLTLDDGAIARARAVILACGVTYRRLGVDHLEALVGAGVYYGAATSHARDVQDAEVVVVGAGNSGGQAAVHLARYAARVTIVARGDDLAESMSAYLIREIEGNDCIEVRTATDVVDGGGEGRLEWVELADRRTGARSRVDAAGLFVLIGTETRTGWLPPDVERDGPGFVLTGAELGTWPLDRPPYAMETSVPGVFAVGDVRANGVKRVAAAVGEGSVSVPMVHRFLAGS